MADTTNITDTLPDGSTVTSNVASHDHGALDASARFGQSHDTWHRESSSVPPGGGSGGDTQQSLRGARLYWNSVVSAAQFIPPDGHPPIVVTRVGDEIVATVDGTLLGRYKHSPVFGPGNCGVYQVPGTSHINAINLDGGDHSAFLAPLHDQYVDVSWTKQ
jgi:hypothetical protein